MAQRDATTTIECDRRHDDIESEQKELRESLQESVNVNTRLATQVESLGALVRDMKGALDNYASAVRTADGRSRLALSKYRVLEKRLETEVIAPVKALQELVAAHDKAAKLTPDQVDWWLKVTPQELFWRYPFRAMATAGVVLVALVALPLLLIAAFGPVGGLRFIANLLHVPGVSAPATTGGAP